MWGGGHLINNNAYFFLFTHHGDGRVVVGDPYRRFENNPNKSYNLFLEKCFNLDLRLRLSIWNNKDFNANFIKQAQCTWKFWPQKRTIFREDSIELSVVGQGAVTLCVIRQWSDISFEAGEMNRFAFYFVRWWAEKGCVRKRNTRFALGKCLWIYELSRSGIYLVHFIYEQNYIENVRKS